MNKKNRVLSIFPRTKSLLALFENPEEHVWKVGKEAVGNQCSETFDDLKNIFESAVTGRKFDYTIRGI